MIGDASAAVMRDQIELMLEKRRRRAGIFGEDLFSDPAWDILLEAFAAQLGNRKLQLATLGAIAPQSTLLRWVAALQDQGLVECETDPLQPDQFWIGLSRDCAEKMHGFVSDAQPLAQLV